MNISKINYKEVAWDHLVPLDFPGCTIDKCIETLNLDDFDISDSFSVGRSSSPIANLNNFSLQKELKSKSNLFLHCVYEEEDVHDLINYFNNIKVIFPESGLLIFSNKFRKVDLNCYFVHVPSSTFEEFEKKVARHLELMVSSQPVGSPLKPLKEELTSVRIETNKIIDKNIVFDQSYILNVNVSDVPFEMHCKFISGSKNLVVLGQDALTRSRVDLPLFFRRTWVSDIPCSTIILNDPTLYLNDSLNGGWFVGTRERDYLQDCANLILIIKEKLKIETPVVFYGASAGGFSALMLSSCVAGSKAIVDIPQIDLPTYHVRAEVEKLFKATFSINAETDFPSHLLHRVNVLKRFSHQKRIPDITYMHNIRDVNHIRQFNSFLEGWSLLSHDMHQGNVGDLNVKTYSRWHLSKGGHFPMSKKKTLKEIINLLK